MTTTTYPLSAVKLLGPVIPPTFYAGGLNYPAHVQWELETVFLGLASIP